MLALTDSAVEAVKDIVSSAGGAAETGGRRLSAVQGAMQTNLQLSVVALPGEDDGVIDEQEARDRCRSCLRRISGRTMEHLSLRRDASNNEKPKPGSRERNVSVDGSLSVRVRPQIQFFDVCVVDDGFPDDPRSDQRKPPARSRSCAPYVRPRPKSK